MNLSPTWSYSKTQWSNCDSRAFRPYGWRAERNILRSVPYEAVEDDGRFRPTVRTDGPCRSIYIEGVSEEVNAVMRVLLMLGLMLGWIGTSAVVVSAQVPMSATEPGIGAVFSGQVVDSVSGDPIEGVLVRMDDGSSAYTNALGEFELTGLRQGRRLFAMLTSDCRVTWGEITVVTGIPRDERYLLPPAFGAAAQAEAEEVEERQRSTGRILEQEEIDRIPASSVLELIRRVAPGMVSPMQGDPGNVSSLVSGRGRSAGAETDAPVVVVDGIRMPGVEGALSTMRPHEISRLEIQPGAAAGWEYGSSGASGVIKITMRRGIADGQAERQEKAACVVPEFLRG